MFFKIQDGSGISLTNSVELNIDNQVCQVFSLGESTMEMILALITFSTVFAALTSQIFEPKKEKKDEKKEEVEFTLKEISFKGEVKKKEK